MFSEAGNTDGKCAEKFVDDGKTQLSRSQLQQIIKLTFDNTTAADVKHFVLGHPLLSQKRSGDWPRASPVHQRRERDQRGRGPCRAAGQQPDRLRAGGGSPEEVWKE
eukprot:2818-Hanusia_phi.AAC.6